MINITFGFTLSVDRPLCKTKEDSTIDDTIGVAV